MMSKKSIIESEIYNFINHVDYVFKNENNLIIFISHLFNSLAKKASEKF